MSTVLKSIEVAVPATTAYNQWTQFEEFPHFMEGVESVQQLDDQRLHWRANIGGQTEEWTAEITEQIPDKRIAWRSLTGAANAGVVTFHRISDDRSRITLQIDYEPKTWSESLGDLLGFLERRVEGDLERFRQFIEQRGRETGAWRGQIASPDERSSQRSTTSQTQGQDRDKYGEESAKTYNREAEAFAQTDKGERAAEEAERALDSAEGEELRRAEQVGRERATHEHK